MPTCVLFLTITVIALITISLIVFWKSNSALGAKWSATIMIFIVGICFFTSFRNEPFKIDDEVAFIGVIAAIVAIPVAILIGWNIYTAIDVKSEIKKMYDLENRIDGKIKDAVSQAKLEIENSIRLNCDNILYHSMYLTFFFQGVTELNKTHGEAAFYYFFRSIECLMKTNIDRDKLGEIIMKINIIIKDYPPVLTSTEAKSYLEQLKSIQQYRGADKIEEYLKSKLEENN